MKRARELSALRKREMWRMRVPLWLQAAGAQYLVRFAGVDDVAELLESLGRKPSPEEVRNLSEDADSKIEHLDEIALRMGLFPPYIYEAQEEILHDA